MLARIWASRGVTDSAEISASLKGLLPYSGLKGVTEFAEVVADAIEAKKRLLIVADYDADGATACAVGVRCLRAFGADIRYLVPSRFEHGYGLTPEIVEEAAKLSPAPDFIITVDNGISSIDGVARANALGIEVLVTDHHLAAQTLPAARVIVNPNQPGCQFPSKALAGCGVIWYCMWALQDELLERGILPVSAFGAIDALALVAVGTIADVVPLDKNNRLLTALGLEQIRRGDAPSGIEALARISGSDPKWLSTTDIAFGVGPRINAAGRLETMNVGVECLVTDNEEDANAHAKRLHEINVQRKEIESETVNQAVAEILNSTNPPEGKASIVAYGPDWHQGVVGIAAGRIKERFIRPTFVLTKGDDGLIKGSGRSIPALHLRDALDLVDKKVPGLLVKFGGHAMAAGLTLRADGAQEFAQAFEEVAKSLLTSDAFQQIVEIDGSLAPSEISPGLASMIETHVWGQAFPAPVFCDFFNVVEAKRIGDGSHLSMKLERQGKQFRAIKFRYEGQDPGERVKLVYKVGLNRYQGGTYLQLLADHVLPG